CKGKASEMLSLPAAVSPETSTAMQRALADELKKSANVSSVNLKDIAYSHFSKSEACFMPYIEANVQGTSESGGNGDNVGGESGGQGGQCGQGCQVGQQRGQSGQQGGQSGGSGSGGGQGGGEQGQSGGEQGGGQQMEFTARKTAVFSRGEFVGILNEQQSFALDIMQDDIRLAVIPFDSEGIHYTLGLKSTTADIKLKVNEGVPELTLKFSAKAQIQGKASVLQPDSIMKDDNITPEVLKSAEEEVQLRLEQLIKTCAESDCDLLGAKELLYKYNNKYFEAFNKDLLTRMKVKYRIDINSVN
ncbi:MAG: Ger(x)C family spore germination C-terminal domain-containing protein, partial [Clostridia bacterium]|nr:Ger(x)C family spore germination C-terminal domain-containing protein [Clostridia bacterium]